MIYDGFVIRVIKSWEWKGGRISSEKTEFKKRECWAAMIEHMEIQGCCAANLQQQRGDEGSIV